MIITNRLYLNMRRSLQFNNIRLGLHMMSRKTLLIRDPLPCTCLANLLPFSKQGKNLMIIKLLSTKLSTVATSIMTPNTPKMKAGRKWLMSCPRNLPILTAKCMWRREKDLQLQSRILGKIISANTFYQCPKFQGLKSKSKEGVVKESWPLLQAQSFKNGDFLWKRRNLHLHIILRKDQLKRGERNRKMALFRWVPTSITCDWRKCKVDWKKLAMI